MAITKPMPTIDRKLEGRIALITGASRGIGAAVAQRFAAEGAHVVLAARTLGGLEEVDDAVQKAGGTATLVQLDLNRDHAKIDELAFAIHKRFTKLDILVGNAGTLGTLSPLSHMEEKVWEEVMRVNLTANWRLIRAFDPLLRASDAGRAIFVSSGLARTPMAYWGPYCTSKAALEMLVQTYALEIEKTNVRANLLNPGVVETAMLAEAFPGGYPGKTSKPHTITDSFVKLALPSYSKNGSCIEA